MTTTTRRVAAALAAAALACTLTTAGLATAASADTFRCQYDSNPGSVYVHGGTSDHAKAPVTILLLDSHRVPFKVSHGHLGKNGTLNHTVKGSYPTSRVQVWVNSRRCETT